MLSLAELRHAAVALSDLSGGSVQRIVQPDDANLYFTFYGYDEDKSDGVKRHLRLCCKGELAHVGETEDLPKAPANPPSFCSLLRAKLERARFMGAEIRHDDRLLALRFKDQRMTSTNSYSLLWGRAAISTSSTEMVCCAAP